ncbi:MAG: hypothetical protein EXR18_04540 [Flavobacteriaceae bacterium]|nr:hypothetical protein [Flavobacteriaceae bacterium]
MIKLKDLLKEYVDTDVVRLQQYLNSTPEQKADEIAGMIGYKQIIDDYFIKNRGLYPKEINPNAGSIPQLYANTLALGKWDVLKQTDPVLYGAIVDWLMDKIYGEEQSFMSFMQGFGIQPAQIPSWFYLHEPTLVRNQWLVHGTSRMDGRMMARRGFIKGINDPTKLGLTTWLQGKKIGDGYNFAYTPKDFALYGVDGQALKYGDGTFLIFRASGIRCWHHADEEFQVIFHGKTARDIVFVDEVMDTYSIYSKKGNPLVQTGTDGKNSPVDLVNWVIDNYDQYRKSIGWEKKPV